MSFRDLSRSKYSDTLLLGCPIGCVATILACNSRSKLYNAQCMDIKNWWAKSYWLKGALVSLTIMGFFFILWQDNLYNHTVYNSLWKFFELFDFIAYPLCGDCNADFISLHTFTVWPVYFIYGSILGWIYGKIKIRNIDRPVVQLASGPAPIDISRPLLFILIVPIIMIMFFLVYIPTPRVDIKSMSEGLNVQNKKVFLYQPKGWVGGCSRCEYGAKELKGIDAETFKNLGFSGFGYVFLDKSGVYFLEEQKTILKKEIEIRDYLIPGADFPTFVRILSTDPFYFKDKNHIYFIDEIVEGADFATFKPLGGGKRIDKIWCTAMDKNNYYLESKIVGNVI